jgi:16S rRNA (guanine966-N2)-methyltransferase
MRIIAGSAKRREIKVPKELVRPTTDRTREALFSILAQYVAEAEVLDIFAGAGSLGLESLSRGAKSCDFVDKSWACTRVIDSNLLKLKLKGGSVINLDAISYIRRSIGMYDLIFCDAPYYKVAGERDFVREILAEENLSKILRGEGLLVLETDSRYSLTLPPHWQSIDRRIYGGCAIHFLKKAC